jgi:hypothetical protein
VATVSPGFSVVGVLAAFRGFDLRLAAIAGPGLFTLGAAIGHVYQMAIEHDFAPGNTGVIFYIDIVIPVFGALLLWAPASIQPFRCQTGLPRRYCTTCLELGTFR